MSVSEDDLKDVSTALLFGNFDENGRLENDIFDSTEQKHLASLSKYVFLQHYVLKIAKNVNFLFVGWVLSQF